MCEQGRLCGPAVEREGAGWALRNPRPSPTGVPAAAPAETACISQASPGRVPVGPRPAPPGVPAAAAAGTGPAASADHSQVSTNPQPVHPGVPAAGATVVEPAKSALPRLPVQARALGDPGDAVSGSQPLPAATETTHTKLAAQGPASAGPLGRPPGLPVASETGPAALAKTGGAMSELQSDPPGVQAAAAAASAGTALPAAAADATSAAVGTAQPAAAMLAKAPSSAPQGVGSARAMGMAPAVPESGSVDGPLLGVGVKQSAEVACGPALATDLGPQRPSVRSGKHGLFSITAPQSSKLPLGSPGRGPVEVKKVSFSHCSHTILEVQYIQHLPYFCASLISNRKADSVSGF